MPPVSPRLTTASPASSEPVGDLSRTRAPSSADDSKAEPPAFKEGIQPRANPLEHQEKARRPSSGTVDQLAAQLSKATLEAKSDAAAGAPPLAEPGHSAFWAREIPARFAQEALKDWEEADDGMIHVAWGEQALCALDVRKWNALKQLEKKSDGVREPFRLVSFKEVEVDVSTFPPDIRAMFEGKPAPKAQSGGMIVDSRWMTRNISANRPAVNAHFGISNAVSDKDVFENHLLPWLADRKDMGDFDEQKIAGRVLFAFGASASDSYEQGNGADNDVDLKMQAQLKERHDEIDAAKPGDKPFAMPSNPAFVRDDSDETRAVDERHTQAGSLMQDRMNALALAHPGIADGSAEGRGRLVGMALANRFLRAPDSVA